MKAKLLSSIIFLSSLFVLTTGFTSLEARYHRQNHVQVGIRSDVVRPGYVVERPYCAERVYLRPQPYVVYPQQYYYEEVVVQPVPVRPVPVRPVVQTGFSFSWLFR